MEGTVVLGAAISATTVSEAVSGDDAALSRIVATYHDDMARVAFVVCGDADLAQDAVQSAWDKAWRKLATLRIPTASGPGSWRWRLTRRGSWLVAAGG